MEIWRKDTNNDNYMLSKITDTDIKLAESHFGIQLPKEYIRLLKSQNGGYIELNCLPVDFENDWADDHIPFEMLFGIKSNKGIMETEYLLKEWGIEEENLVLISGDGHFWVALDYRQNSENPKIVYINTDTKDIINIYDSFKEMISNLYEEEYSNQGDEFDLQKFLIENKQRIEQSYNLLESKNAEDIIIGMMRRKNAIGISLNDDDFIEKLISFLTHDNKEVRVKAAEYISDYIIKEYITDSDVINNVLSILEKENISDIQYFLEEMMNHVNK